MENTEKVGGYNPRAQGYLEFLSWYKYVLEYRKGAANNGNADLRSSLLQPATVHDRTSCISLTLTDDDVRINLVRACGLRTNGPATAGVYSKPL